MLQYQVTGTPTISLQFEGATGATVAGTFAAFQGTTVAGANPSTSTTCSTVTNCVAIFSGFIPWYRITMTLSGTGTVSGTLQGYKTYVAAGGNTPSGGSGCVGTVAVPCIVAGNVADGSPVAGSPVRVGGKDASGNVQDVLTATDGSIVPAHGTPATADGIAGTRTATDDASNPLYYREIPWIWNGATFDRKISCPNTAAITFTAASGSLEIVGLTAANVIQICSLWFSSDTVTNITFQNGTGSNCGTGTTTIAGVMQNVLSMSIYWGADAALRVPASNAFCINSSATATIGGGVTYAKF